MSDSIVERRRAGAILRASWARSSPRSLSWHPPVCSLVKSLRRIPCALVRGGNRGVRPKKDTPRYLKNMEAAIAQRPVHPTFLRRLAGAYALNRRAADAAGVLRRWRRCRCITTRSTIRTSAL